MGKKSRAKLERRYAGVEAASAAAKADVLLTSEERAERVEKLRDLFREKDAWYPASYGALAEFDAILRKFVEDGQSVTGKIWFPEIEKHIFYIINNKRRHAPTLHLLNLQRTK